VLNRMSRYHLVLDALRHARRTPERGEELAAYCRQMLAQHDDYIREHFEDMPEVRNWRWSR
jgi:xylulose-5-phosphate/fructose-6-phosphate phosphoketolase